jgi:hypothetical protein
MERIINLLERFVLAVEGICAFCTAYVESCTEDEQPGNENDAPEIYAQTASVDEDVNENGITVTTKKAPTDREVLLARCAELGITVPNKARTTTLVKLVEKAEATPPPAPVVIGVTTAPSAVTAVITAPEYTVDKIRAALINLCKANNNDASIVTKIVSSVGAETISGIDPSKYPEVVAKIKEKGGEV